MKIKIQLTNRPPVVVDENQWPVIASAEEEDRHGAQYGNQPNREENWSLKVRQNGDRFIVYGKYTYETIFQGETGYSYARGSVITGLCNVVSAINSVAELLMEDLDAADLTSEANVFNRLAQECIADLPPEEL